MKKCIILILMWALMFVPVFAEVDCQISTDNSTWINVTSPLYGGVIDNERNISYVQNVDENTEYFFRCKNNDTVWGYDSTTTNESDGEKKMIIAAIILLPMILGICLLIAGSTMSERHDVLKIFLFLCSFVAFWGATHFAGLALIQYFSTWTAGLEQIAFFARITGYLFFIICSYYFLYLIYTVYTKIAEKKKERLQY